MLTNLILFTMSHELVHMIREGSPEDYKALADFFVSKYAEKGIDVDDLVRLKMEEYGAPKYLAMKEMGKSTNLTYDEALEEVIADSCESFLLDLADAKRGAEISQQLKKENPTLWDRIKDALYNILQRVRNAYRLAKPQSREAQIIAQMKDIIEPAYEIYVRGYTNSARNLRNTEGSRQSGTKYEIRYPTYTQNDIEENCKKLRQMAVVKSLTGKEFAKGEKKFSEQIRDFFDSLGNSVYSEAFGDVGLTNSSVRSDIRHGMTAEKNASYAAILEVIKQGVVIFSVDKGYNVERLVVAAPISIDGTKYNMGVMLQRDPQSQRLYAHDVVTIEEPTAFSGNHLTTTGSTAENDKLFLTDILQNALFVNPSTRKNQSRTDSKYLSAVERGDMETAQRMVDEAAERAFADSKIRDENGKLIKVYHGTYADFTVFDKTMGRSTADIQGMFFSPWDIDAGGYGPNVRAFYLNITNPASESTGYKALNSHKGENYIGIKAREDLERKGYDGVNNSDEEYIAFNSEQIKSADPVTYDDNGNVIPLSERFNESNKDIRYQERSKGYYFGDFDFDLIEDDGSIENSFAREYSKHSEDIGEVLKNIAAIDIAPNKVESIIRRVVRDSLGGIDSETVKTLSTELQFAMEFADRRDDYEKLSNEMISAVRKAINNATVMDERAEANYKDLLGAFKGKRFYLTDEQLADLRER